MEEQTPLQNPPKPTSLGKYFKEFLMLFLAVFFGFLVENYREQQEEKSKADELAHSFYAELKEDSASIAQAMMQRLKREESLLYLRSYFKNGNLENVSKTFTVQFYTGFFLISRTHFTPQNVLLEQIRNSGSLEYFKDAEISRLTGKLAEAIVRIQNRNEVERTYMFQYFHPVTQAQMDIDWMNQIDATQPGKPHVVAFNAYAESSDSIPFYLADLEAINRKSISNMLGIQRYIVKASRENQYKNYAILNAELLEKLRKAYRIQ